MSIVAHWRDHARWDRLFFVAMGCGILLVNIVLFTVAFMRTPIAHELQSPWVRVHATAFAAWLLMFIAQATLALRGRLDLHRRFGVWGAMLAALMIALTVISGLERYLDPTPRPGLDRFMLSFVVHVDMVVFTGFVVAGLWARRTQPEWHKRMMLLATICVGMRFPVVDIFIRTGVPHYVDQCLTVVVAMAFDYAMRRRVHPAYFVGFAAMLVLPLIAEHSFRYFAPHLVVQPGG